ncbi:menaquinone-specific isochorismate synthase [Cutibacterium acnes JCM 18909]|nr:menaquinone-specific isochorismate synthase [Cutibacterium acnes JCM 18909]
MHRNYGMVGLGEVTRFETDSPAAADVWWEALCDDLEHETEMPGAEATDQSPSDPSPLTQTGHRHGLS